MYKDLKVVFMGTPEFGKEAFDYLIENTNVVLAVMQPDKEVGRKRVLTSPFIKQMAIQNGIEVFQPVKIRNDYDVIKKLEPDLIVTAAYGQIVPKEVLDIPTLGCINLHGSVLPKYRGAAPIQYALLNGDKTTGVSLMYMDEQMDTGDIIDILEIDIDPLDNYPSLYTKLGVVAKEVLSKNMEYIANRTNNRIKQDDSLAIYSPMIKREDELIDFNKSCEEVCNKIRGIYPNAYFIINDEPMKVLEASYVLKNVDRTTNLIEVTKNTLGISTIDGIVYLKTVKPFGKKVMDIKSYLNGIDKNSINL